MPAETMVMTSMIRRIASFLQREDGPTAVEYAFLLVLILVVALTAITLFGEATGECFQNSSDEINGVM
jgi:pilus assembly protein Flp/PilA